LKGLNVGVHSLKDAFFKNSHCEKQSISSYGPS
jgi:hypothetical protein